MNGLARYGNRTLSECEAAIIEHLDGASTAYREIKERKLYKDTHSRWEDYCRERWAMSVDKVDRIIATERLIEAISEIPQPCGKISQSAASEIADLEPEQQREVISKVKASGKKPTAAAVKEARQEVAPKEEKPKPQPEPEDESNDSLDGVTLAKHLKAISDAGKAGDHFPESRRDIEQAMAKWVRKWSQASSKFTPPTVEEVAAYIREKRYQFDAEAFVSFYASKGWKVGNQPMKDWRAAVVTWSKNKPKVTGAVPVPAGKYDFIDNAT